MHLLRSLLTKHFPLGFDLGTLLLRLSFGGFMVVGHGWGKLNMLLSGNHSSFPDPLGIGTFFSLLGAVLTEVVCGFLVTIGFVTRLAVLGLIFTMIVAAFIVHLNSPFFDGPGVDAAKEMAVLYLVGYVVILILGPGRFSFDSFISAK